MTAELVPTDNMAAVEALDPAARDARVAEYLVEARDRLAWALEATGPEDVAMLRAEIGTVADMSKRLGLSGLLNNAETIRRTTGQAKAHCVAAAAVEIINAGRGGKKLASWWREDAA